MDLQHIGAMAHAADVLLNELQAPAPMLQEPPLAPVIPNVPPPPVAVALKCHDVLSDSTRASTSRASRHRSRSRGHADTFQDDGEYEIIQCTD